MIIHILVKLVTVYERADSIGARGGELSLRRWNGNFLALFVSLLPERSKSTLRENLLLDPFERPP